MILNTVDFTVVDTPATIALFHATAAAVRASPGCLRYDIFADPTSADRLLIVQKWADIAAFDTFRAGPEMAAQMAGMGPLMTGAPRSVTMAVHVLG